MGTIGQPPNVFTKAVDPAPDTLLINILSPLPTVTILLLPLADTYNPKQPGVPAK